MEPRIDTLQELKLIGQRTRMSYAANKTRELWQSFMPRRHEVKNARGSELYSVEVYPNAIFFEQFDPASEFEKWAAVAVTGFQHIPAGMESLLIPGGLYAVFIYKGKPSEAQAAYQYIYGSWLPKSAYKLDDRPHFALMGAKYKGEHPDSEEELWVPVKAGDR